MVFKRSSMGVWVKFQMCFKDVSGKFLGCFKEDWEVLLETYKGDLRELQGYLKEIQRLFPGSFKAVSKDI